ncbi:MAG: hypothetical protein RBR78_09475 [Flavobacteriaceae bacterium]|nr:hypothetical protein [Flavobacteriaceae bacterium]
MHTGINGTVVVVGVKCLFAIRALLGTGSYTPQERGCVCACVRGLPEMQKV